MAIDTIECKLGVGTYRCMLEYIGPYLYENLVELSFLLADVEP